MWSYLGPNLTVSETGIAADGLSQLVSMACPSRLAFLAPSLKSRPTPSTVVMRLVTSSDALVTSSFLLLVVIPGATFVAFLLLAALPFSPGWPCCPPPPRSPRTEAGPPKAPFSEVLRQAWQLLCGEAAGALVLKRAGPTGPTEGMGEALRFLSCLGEGGRVVKHPMKLEEPKGAR